MKYLVGLFLIFLCSCTISVVTTHTQGQAEDVVDETQSNTPTVNPNINIPIPSLPGLK